MSGTPMLGFIVVLLCGTALTSCAQSGSAADRPKPRTHTVMIEAMVFRPKEITVTAGDTVVWVNRDLVHHTVTSSAAAFDSHVVETNGSWRHTFDQTGDFAYICSFHPTMTGQLRVR